MKDINLTTKLALEGILQAASLGLVILQQLPLAEVHHDKIRMAALERQIEIISEASRKVPDHLKNKIPLNWRGIAAIGNILRHEYKNVHSESLWHFANDDLEKITQWAKSCLKDIS